MAVNPLSLAESLRPWRTAGVTHLLCEVPGEEDTAAPHTRALSPYSSVEPALWDDQEMPPPTFARNSAARRPIAPSRPRLKEEHAPPPEGGAPDAAPPFPASAIRPDTWPSAWQSVFARTRPAPVLWTYPELGLDLSGRGSQERSSCLKELIGKLQLPRGSSAFWPLRFDGDDGEEGDTHGSSPEGKFFKAGLDLLQPKVIVLIGPEAARLADAGLTLSTPFTQEISRGMLFVLLPEFAALLENPSLADKACVFLRTALGGISALFQERQP